MPSDTPVPIGWRRCLPSPRGRVVEGAEQRVPVGRRVFLGLVGLGAVGIVSGAKVQNVIGNVGRLSSGRSAAIRGSFPHLFDRWKVARHSTF